MSLNTITVRLTLTKLLFRSAFYPRRRLFSAQNACQPDECDIVIVGGGPAGLALASALGSRQPIRESLKVTLVEAGDLSKVQDWMPSPEGFSNRVSSLTNASQDFLREIGAWDYVDVERTAPIEEMQVWDGISDARIKFNASDLGSGQPALGAGQMALLTENLSLQRALLRHLSTIPEVQLCDKVKVALIQLEERGGGGGWPLVHLSDGRVLRTRLLVGADGFHSPVRSYAGISSYGWSYDTQAIVATLSHPPRGVFQSPNTTAYQRFLPTGPIAFLPLSPTTSSLVWSTKPSLASALTKGEPDVLANMINAAFRLPEVSVRYLHNLILGAQKAEKQLSLSEIQTEITFRERSHSIPTYSAYSSSCSLDGIPPTDSSLVPPVVTSIQLGTIASFPLRFNHADSYIGEGNGARTVLVGDAAHTIHPLAGQGLNLGLGDAECLARCVEEAVLQGGDIVKGSQTALLPYAQGRYFANHKVMAAIDKLHKLYSSTFEPLVWARSVGLEVINELDTMKAAIVMAAGGSRRSGYERFGATGWPFAARGVETVIGGVGAAKVVCEMISYGLQGLLRGRGPR